MKKRHAYFDFWHSEIVLPYTEWEWKHRYNPICTFVEESKTTFEKMRVVDFLYTKNVFADFAMEWYK